jgi:hypothetical protein
MCAIQVLPEFFSQGVGFLLLQQLPLLSMAHEQNRNKWAMGRLLRSVTGALLL